MVKFTIEGNNVRIVFFQVNGLGGQSRPPKSHDLRQIDFLLSKVY